MYTGTKITKIAAINVKMDALAGQHVGRLLSADIDTSEPTLFPSQQISVIVNKKRVHANIEDAMIFQYFKKPIEKHYTNVVKLDPNEFDNVRWNALRLTLRDSKKHDQTLKAIHSQWQTKHVCHRWKLTEDPICPLCDESTETWEHVLQFPNIHMQRVRDESIIKLSKILTELKTHNKLRDHIILIIRSWLSSSEIPTLSQSFLFPISRIQQAQIEQSKISFNLMMKGLISRKWGEIQESDYDNNNMPAIFNKLRWEKALISHLQTMTVDMWNERCKIVTAGNIESSEMRYRQKAWEFLCEIRNNNWKLTHDCLHLIDRDEWFFKSSNLITAQTWYDNINVAIDRSNKKHNGVLRDIRKFFVREEGFVQVRTKVAKMTEAAKLEIARVKSTVQQNLSNIFRQDPSLGR